MEKNRAWRQAGLISIQNFSDNLNAQQQVAQEIHALSTASNLRLPEFILTQVQESILRALGEHAAKPLQPSSASPSAPAAKTIQLGVHFADAQADGVPGTQPSARWGFFLVKKRGSRPGAPCLILDLYLYQE